MKHALLAIHIGVATTAIGSAATLTETFSSFYAFGDSLTDDGKAGPGVFSDVSDDGRFSNGPTYAEFIADAFDAAGADTGNLALGGATATEPNASPINDLSTFGGQIDVFSNALDNNTGLPQSLDLTDLSPAPVNPGDNPLVSVFFGGNDVLRGVDPILAANAVTDGILEIAGLAGGDLFDTFLVFNQPDAGATPFAASVGQQAAFSGASNAFNAQLASNLGGLSAQGLNIIPFDTPAAVAEITEDIATGGQRFNISASLFPCISDITDTTAPNCIQQGVDPNTLFFNDGVHPNATVQAFFGEEAIRAVNANLTPVPVPASMPLLLVGFGAFAGLRLRKRAA